MRLSAPNGPTNWKMGMAFCPLWPPPTRIFPLNSEYLRSCKACGRRIHTEVEHKSRIVLLFLRQKDDAVFPWRQRRTCRDLRPRTIWKVNNRDGDFVFLAT